jgi:hypothetical protein
MTNKVNSARDIFGIPNLNREIDCSSPVILICRQAPERTMNGDRESLTISLPESRGEIYG